MEVASHRVHDDETRTRIGFAVLGGGGGGGGVCACSSNCSASRYGVEVSRGRQAHRALAHWRYNTINALCARHDGQATRNDQVLNE